MVGWKRKTEKARCRREWGGRMFVIRWHSFLEPERRGSSLGETTMHCSSIRRTCSSSYPERARLSSVGASVLAGCDDEDEPAAASLPLSIVVVDEEAAGCCSTVVVDVAMTMLR